MKKTKTITIQTAIDRYYKRNSKKLDAIFGSEASAKAHLEYDTNHGSYKIESKRATKLFNDYIDKFTSKNPDLIEAMQSASNVGELLTDLGKKNKRGLNKKISATSIIDNRYIGEDSLGNELTLLEYHDIKNSNMVLAHMSANNGSSPYDYWSYEDRNYLGV